MLYCYLHCGLPLSQGKANRPKTIRPVRFIYGKNSSYAAALAARILRGGRPGALPFLCRRAGEPLFALVPRPDDGGRAGTRGAVYGGGRGRHCRAPRHMPCGRARRVYPRGLRREPRPRLCAAPRPLGTGAGGGGGVRLSRRAGEERIPLCDRHARREQPRERRRDEKARPYLPLLLPRAMAAEGCLRRVPHVPARFRRKCRHLPRVLGQIFRALGGKNRRIDPKGQNKQILPFCLDLFYKLQHGAIKNYFLFFEAYLFPYFF